MYNHCSTWDSVSPTELARETPIRKCETKKLVNVQREMSIGGVGNGARPDSSRRVPASARSWGEGDQLAQGERGRGGRRRSPPRILLRVRGCAGARGVLDLVKGVRRGAVQRRCRLARRLGRETARRRDV